MYEAIRQISTLKPCMLLLCLENTLDTNMNLPLCKDSGFTPMGNPHILQSNNPFIFPSGNIAL